MIDSSGIYSELRARVEAAVGDERLLQQLDEEITATPGLTPHWREYLLGVVDRYLEGIRLEREARALGRREDFERDATRSRQCQK